MFHSYHCAWYLAKFTKYITSGDICNSQLLFLHNYNLHQREEKLLPSGQGQLEQVQFYR